MGKLSTGIDHKCRHCQEECGENRVNDERGNVFCCQGCSTVYQLLAENNLLNFYDLDQTAGKKQQRINDTYDWLLLPELANQLIQYQDEKQLRIDLELPDIHCLSCVWLLENLNAVHSGIIRCQINYARKRAVIFLDPKQINLSEAANLLARIGYPPKFDRKTTTETSGNQGLYLRLGLAGFAFGNIMLLSFPEYFGIASDLGAGLLNQMANYLMLALSIPVLFFGGDYYLRGAYEGLKQRYISFDVPIALGMMALFGWSVYEILVLGGAGYLDSLTGLIFFLLIGRWFQSLTYERLNFNRDYQDYFPVAAYAISSNGELTPVATDELEPATNILVRPGQLIPADGILQNEAATRINYSFVTGEAEPQRIQKGQQVFAGGRAVNDALRILTTAKVQDSYLLQLWQDTDHQSNADQDVFSAKVSKYFTITIITIACLTLLYWKISGAAFALEAAIAVLIIACPCALALAKPFAYGTMMRLLAKRGLYLRSSNVLDKMSVVDQFVFDKTGTLLDTSVEDGQLRTHLGTTDSAAIFLAMALQSEHPKSKQIVSILQQQGLAPVSIPTVEESAGAGLEVKIEQDVYRIGSATFCQLPSEVKGTYLVCNDEIHYELSPGLASLRPGANTMLNNLASSQKHLISGDQAYGQQFWADYFDQNQLHFNQSPFDKKDYLNRLKENGHHPVMVGDGLNDTGALQTAHLGIAVTEDIADFSPACDGILLADKIATLPHAITAAARLPLILKISYGLAFIYNLIGLSFAVSGQLSPVIAAILMPLSSITVVLLAVGLSTLVYNSHWLR